MEEIAFAEIMEEIKGKLTQFASAVQDSSHKLTSLTGELNIFKISMLDATEAFRPFAITQLTRAVLDLKAVFGQIFLPVIQQVTDAARVMADYFYNLPDSFKEAIGGIARSGIFAGLASSIALAAYAFALLAIPVRLISGAIEYLYRAFTNTVGGARALGAYIDNWERSLAGLIQAIQYAWDATKDLRSELADAFSELGYEMSEFWDAVRPIIAAGLSVFAMALAEGLKLLTKVIIGLTYLATELTKAMTALISPFSRMLSLLGISLPTVQHGKASSYGLGWSTARVDTDPNSIYNRITEELLRNTRTGEEGQAEEPAVSIKNNVAAITPKLLQWLERQLGSEGRTRGGAVGVVNGLILN